MRAMGSLPDVKPLFRGRLHQVAFFVAIPAGIALVVASPTTSARVAAIVYALALAGLYGTSALYHRLPWSPKARRWMQRLDHSMIFVLIAGTYTPFALLVLHGAAQVVVLTVVWVGAIVGVVLKMVRIDGLKAVTATLYIGLGWLAIVAAPQIYRGLSGVSIGLLLAGGLLYTAGAIMFAAKRPNPSPRVFGYHEVWHSMVIGGSACHFVVILLLILALR